MTWSRDSTVHGPAIREKWSPPIRLPPISNTDGSRICEDASLYGLRIGTTCSTRGRPRGRGGDVLAVADGADHRHLLAARGVGLRPAGLDALDDGLDLVLGRPRFHHDHHQPVSWCRL